MTAIKIQTSLAVAGLLAVTALTPLAGAATIGIPNGSFESPNPPPGFPAWPVIDSWQKFPQPAGLTVPPGFTWDQLSGVFVNTPVGASDHIDNVDGAQAAYLFSIPGVVVFQAL